MAHHRAAILFDLDGTLVDSREDLATAVNLVRADLGAPALPVATVAGFVGDGVPILVARSLADLGGGVDLERAGESMREHYAAHLTDRSYVYEGVREALARLRDAGLLLAVVTNKPEAPAREICARLGLLPALGAVVGGDTCRERKPHPEPLAAALRRLGADAPGSWMVGDGRNDLAAGRRLGLRRCFARYGFGAPGDEGWDLAVDDLRDFVAEILPPTSSRHD
jgi:phosphoglycolate phosphatase